VYTDIYIYIYIYLYIYIYIYSRLLFIGIYRHITEAQNDRNRRMKMFMKEFVFVSRRDMHRYALIRHSHKVSFAFSNEHKCCTALSYLQSAGRNTSRQFQKGKNKKPEMGRIQHSLNCVLESATINFTCLLLLWFQLCNFINFSRKCLSKSNSI
jgi:hypothetical protein